MATISASDKVADLDTMEDMEVEFYSLSNVKEELPDPIEIEATEVLDTTQHAETTAHSELEASGTPDTDAAGDGRRDQYFEVVPSAPFMCRCQLCNVKMAVGSFRKHVKSQLHMQQLQQRSERLDDIDVPEIKLEPTLAVHNSRKWEIYAERHPWLIPDPIEPACAYCKYCEKRLVYGYSESKRITHENGVVHQKALQAFENRPALDADGVDSGGDSSTKPLKKPPRRMTTTSRLVAQVESENNDNDEEDDATNDSDSSYAASKQSKRRYKRGTDDWFRMYPCYERYDKDPNYMYCKYCRVLLSIQMGRTKHENCTRHVIGAKEHKSHTAKKLSPHKKIKRRAKVHSMRYAWLACAKNSKAQVLCKYCRVWIAYSSRAKHDASQRHKMSTAAFRKWKQSDEKAVKDQEAAEQEAVAAPLPKKEKVVEPVKTAPSQVLATSWYANFTWIVATKDRPNYAHCKICETDVFLPTSRYASKHHRSPKHVRCRIKLKRKLNQMTSSTEEQVGLKNKYPWYVPIPTNHTHGMCRYCNVAVLFSCQRIHQISGRHKYSKRMYHQANSNSCNKEHVTAEPEQQHNGTANDTANDLTSDNTENKPENCPDAKRTKITYENAVETANRLTDAHSDLLRLRKPRQHAAETSTGTALPLAQTVVPPLPNAIGEHITSHSSPVTSPTNVSATPTRNPMSLFIESVSETVKALPADLRTEWKSKVMQLVCDLELRALRRQQGICEMSPVRSYSAPSPNSSLSDDVVAGTAFQQNHDRIHSQHEHQHRNNSIGAAQTQFNHNHNTSSLHANASSTIKDQNQKNNGNSPKIIKITSNSSGNTTTALTALGGMHYVPRKLPVRPVLPKPPINLQLHRVPFSQPTPPPSTRMSGVRPAFSMPAPYVPQPPTPVVRNCSNGIRAGTTGDNIIRHIQINSQTQSTVIPLNSSLITPQRRYSLNLTPPTSLSLPSAPVQPSDLAVSLQPGELWTTPCANSPPLGNNHTNC